METHVVKGKKCLDYIDVLKKLINVNITDIKHTNEYYETETEVIESENAEIRYE